MQNIRAQSPYELGLCTKLEIEDAVERISTKPTNRSKRTSRLIILKVLFYL